MEKNKVYNKKSITIIFYLLLIVGIVLYIVGYHGYNMFHNIDETHTKKLYEQGLSDDDIDDLIDQYTICMGIGFLLIPGAFIYKKIATTKAIEKQNYDQKTANNNENNISQKLEELKRLLDNGTITQEDYDKKKKDLLDKIYGA